MTKATLDLDFARRQFPNLGNGWAYFENAGGSYLPQSVIRRMNAFMTECQLQPEARNPLSGLSTERLESSRNLMAEMINAAPDEIVIGPSTTLNVYVLAQALRPLFKPGDEIIVTNQDHEANSGAWRRLEEFGLTIREWRIDPDSGTRVNTQGGPPAGCRQPVVETRTKVSDGRLVAAVVRLR